MDCGQLTNKFLKESGLHWNTGNSKSISLCSNDDLFPVDIPHLYQPLIVRGNLRISSNERII